MEDAKIIDLFWARNEDAIAETDAAYGRKLRFLANKILNNFEDAEESVSDTYMKTWEVIPPQRPVCFYAFIASICRHLSFHKVDWNRAAKRNAEVVALTDEMELCIPDTSRDRELEAKELGRVLNAFLESLPKACPSPTVVVVFPSPAGVGLIAVTRISFPSGFWEICFKYSSESFALYFP